MKKIVALVLLTFLVVTYVMPANAAAAVQDYLAPWYDSIPEMLAAGEYEEGVVVVSIDMSKAKRPGDPASALEKKCSGKMQKKSCPMTSALPPSGRKM